LDSALQRPRWTPGHHSGNSISELRSGSLRPLDDFLLHPNRPGSSRPLDDLHLHPNRPSTSRTSSTRGEASVSTAGSRPESRNGPSANNAGIGHIQPLDAVSQERQVMHELFTRRANRHFRATENVSCLLMHRHLGLSISSRMKHVRGARCDGAIPLLRHSLVDSESANVMI
jgi:hypothetical protein